MFTRGRTLAYRALVFYTGVIIFCMSLTVIDCVLGKKSSITALYQFRLMTPEQQEAMWKRVMDSFLSTPPEERDAQWVNSKNKFDSMTPKQQQEAVLLRSSKMHNTPGYDLKPQFLLKRFFLYTFFASIVLVTFACFFGVFSWCRGSFERALSKR